MAMFASCSGDQLIEENRETISYQVSATNQTRAANSYDSNHLPGSFKVWAKNTDGSFINGEEIMNNGGNWSGTNVYFWPEKALDFYASVNGDIDMTGSSPAISDFTVKSNVSDQEDLMYAVALGRTRAQGAVELNFRHALSQVCFKAKNSSSHLGVVINSVSICNVAEKGTFSLPTKSTTYNYTLNNGTAANVNYGTWKIASDDKANKIYDVSVKGIEIKGDTGIDGGSTNLTCPDGNNDNTNVMTLLPQTVAAWNPAVKAETFVGAYFLLDVKLSMDKKEVYNNKVAVPVNVDWKPGYRYIYTFIFDNGSTGGYTPNPSNPQPVLATIQYKVTVDDFIMGDSDVSTGAGGNGGGNNGGDDDDNRTETEENGPKTVSATGSTGSFNGQTW